MMIKMAEVTEDVRSAKNPVTWLAQTRLCQVLVE